MSEPRSLSVILCTYNRAEGLRRTLQQLARVRMPGDVRVEFVVIDNNSADATAAVCRDFERTSPVGFKHGFEPKPGLSFARNHGLAIASGEVVLFVDDDIDVPEDWIEGYVDTYRRHAADAVFGKIIPEWGSGGRPDWYHPRLSAIYGDLDYGPVEQVVSNRKREFFGANFSVRKQLLEAVGAFDTTLGRTPEALYISEERKVFLNLMSRGCRIVYNPGIAVRHRVSPVMKTRDYVERYYRDTSLSLVNMTPPESKRRVLGVPYYRALDAVRNVALFAPRAIAAILSGDTNAVYPLRLEAQRSVKVCLLHMRNWIG